jgi:acyl carrier protein
LFSDDESILKDDASFIKGGFIDSTGIMEIVLFIEDTFNIKVAEEEVTPENLDSINALVAFVEKKVN